MIQFSENFPYLLQCSLNKVNLNYVNGTYYFQEHVKLGFLYKL